MKPKRISWALVCLGAALALMVSVATHGAAASTLRLSDQSWTDPTGDAQGGAPDLTAVAVSNDAAGTITMQVTVPMVTDTMLVIVLDTNLNGRVDDSADCFLGVIGTGPGVIFVVPAVGNTVGASIPSLRWSSTATTVTVSVARTDLGIVKGFAFQLATFTYAQLDEDADFGDVMPDDNSMYVYLVTTPSTFRPVIGAPVTTPKAAVAGRRFTVAFPVTRSDTGAPLTTGTMTCDPKVGTTVVAHAESFTGGTAKLAFVVPRSAKGKLLKVKVTIRAGTAAATKVASFKVR